MRHSLTALYLPICMFLLWPLYQHVNAQSNASFFRYERSTAFEHTSITALHQDKQGYIWIGTQGTLYRYDGHSFQSFFSNPEDSTSLGSDFILSIVEDCRGDTWIGTREGGISRFNARTQKFDSFALAERFGGDIMDDRVRSIHPDEDCKLWIGTGSGKLIRYDIAENLFESYAFSHTDSASVQLEIYAVYGAPSEPNSLWIGRQDGLYNFNKSTEVFTRISNLDNIASNGRKNVVYTILEDSMDRLWLGTNEHGLLFYNRIDGSITQYSTDSEDIPHNTVLSLAEGPDNVLWIGTQGGLSKFNPEAGQFENYTYSLDNDKSLSHDIVTALLVDESSLLWIGTYLGLNKFNPLREYITFYGRPNGGENVLSDAEVITVAEDSSYIWVGTENAGLNRINRQSKKIEHILADDKFAGIYALFVDSEGNVWFSSSGEVLYCLDRTGNLVKTDTLISKIDGVSSTIRSINASRKDPDLLWIGTSASGVFSYNKKTSQTTQYVKRQGDSTSLSHNHIAQIFEDADGNLWVATMGGGVSVLLNGSINFQHINELIADGEKIKSNNVTSIAQDGLGNLWMGTFDKGLIRFHVSSGEIEHFNKSNGLPVSYISGVIVDADNVIWLASNQGIIRFEYATKRVSVFGPADGLQGKLFREGAFLLGKSGEIYAGGVHGLNIFNPEDLKPLAPTKAPVLTSIHVNDILLPLDSLASLQQEISFPYNKNFITFQVSMMDYKDPSENEYSFFLEGVDNKRFEAGNQASIRYSDLSPAKYSLLVKGANSHKEWSPEVELMSFEIKAAWWNRTWFRFLMSVVLIYVGYIAYRSRVNQLLKMERMRFQIARDLHDDLGGELSSIALLADMVHRRADLEDVDLGRMKKIVNTAQRMVREIRDIIWLIEPTHDNVDDLITKMQNIASQRLAHIDNTFSVEETLTNVVLDMDTRRNFLLCYKEILHNVVKHANASSVAIDLTESDSWILLSVIDNGVGIAPDIMSTSDGNGLRNLALRAQEMKGDFKILPIEKGTHMVLKIKNPART